MAKKSDGIKLSPKHGVNPALDVCFWCGQERGVALFGKIDKKDSEAPKRVVTSYEPCDKCKELFSRGIHVIGCVSTPSLTGMPPIGRDEDGNPVYPDGSFAVVTEDSIRSIINDDPEVLGEILVARKMLMPSEILKQALSDVPEEGDRDEDNSTVVSDSDGD